MIFIALVGCFLALPALAEKWAVGKLVLTSSAMTDGYSKYKVVLQLEGGKEGALLWNRSGNFQPEADDPEAQNCDTCRIIQELLSLMLNNCKTTQADFCMHEVPIRYHVAECVHGTVSCLAIDFPTDPTKGMKGRHKTFFVVSPIQPIEELNATLSEACIASPVSQL
jgi:hypothetical protein